MTKTGSGRAPARGINVHKFQRFEAATFGTSGLRDLRTAAVRQSGTSDVRESVSARVRTHLMGVVS